MLAAHFDPLHKQVFPVVASPTATHTDIALHLIWICLAELSLSANVSLVVCADKRLRVTLC